MYVYDSSRFGANKDRWTTAADSTIAHLASHPSSRPDLTFVAQYRGTDLVFESQHLTCFDGGNFLLGGKVLGRQDYIDFGLALVNGCHDTYVSTLTGIGPETFSWNTTTLPPAQAAFYEKSGFWIENGQYITRPEVVESYYYAYRITGNQTYQDWAWDAFLAINSTTRTSTGFSSISDVNAPGGGTKLDNQESFLFAEVLKYSYLIQASVREEYTVEFSVLDTQTDELPSAGRRLAGRTRRQERVRLQYRGASAQGRWDTGLVRFCILPQREDRCGFLSSRVVLHQGKGAKVGGGSGSSGYSEWLSRYNTWSDVW